MPAPTDRRRQGTSGIAEFEPVDVPDRSWVQLLAADSQLSYCDPVDFTRWLRSSPPPLFIPPAFRGAALALFATSVPALILAAVELARHPSLVYVPWLICSLLAGMWPFYEVPGHLRISPSAFVTVAAFVTSGFSLGVWCATVTAVASWAASGGLRTRSRGHFFLANWANLVLAAAAGAMVFDRVLGLTGDVNFTSKLASDRFLAAYPASLAAYVAVNTTLASLGNAARHQESFAGAWKRSYAPVGLLLSVGVVQVLSFIIAFGSWGGLATDSAGTLVAFLITLILLGAGKQAVLQHEARSHIGCLAALLRVVTRPDHRKYPLAAHLLDGLLAQGTRRFLSGIPPEELTFEAEEAVFDAEIAWKLGASENSMRSYLAQHETPEGSGPFGLRELGLPVWSPSFPRNVERPRPVGREKQKPEWGDSVLRCLLDAADPPAGDLADENRKWSRLARSGARTVHSILERYDFGRRLTQAEDLHWWVTCDLAGFQPSGEAESPLAQEDIEPQAGI